MKVWRTMLALMAVTLVVAAACGGDGDDDKKTPSAGGTPTSETSDGAETVSVQVDGDGDGFEAYMIAFFPKVVTLHPGDTVKYKLQDSGEPHTVTAGGPVTALIDVVVGYCGPELFASPKCNEEAPPPPPEVEEAFNTAFEAIPQLLPDGPGDANQTASNPCFLATGTLPDDAPCAEIDQPAFTGAEVLYSSGWLGEDEFVVELADDIAPGAYTFLCLLHGPEMTSTINVVADSAAADSADDVKARLDEEVAAFQQTLAALAAELAAFAGSDEGGVHVDVQADAGASAGVPAGLAAFGPDEVSIPVGGSVSWLINSGAHTVSINVPEDAKTLRVVASDGTIHLNEPAGSPAQVVVPEPPEEEPPPEGEGEAPPEEEGPPPVLDGGTWDGEGFLSTGVLFEGIFKLTFSAAGTYEYKCVIHENMEGTVKVGE